MQTFMPHQQLYRSAEVLDRQRLGKQRVETMQIMKALLQGHGWVNHPATRMWRGYELALLRYQEAVCKEWTGRGYKDTCLDNTTELYFTHRVGEECIMPPWMGDPAFHRSHQSNLIRKFPEHYGPLFPGVPDDLDYIWPEIP